MLKKSVPQLSGTLRLVMEDFDKLRRRYTGSASESVDFITLPGELYDITDENRGIREGEIRIGEYVTIGLSRPH